MPNARETFNSLLTEAVREYVERGFTSIERLNYWTERLRRSAIATMMPGQRIEEITRQHMQAILKREIDRGGLLKLHPGVPGFRLKDVRPKLRGELDRRVRAAADLIVLDKQAAVEKTIQRFSGWLSSIPPGGTRAADKMKVKEDIRKPMSSLPFNERRVLIDQGHKFTQNLSEIIALDNGALAGHWVSHYEQPGYNYRPEHKHFDVDDKFFIVRDNWAMKKGLMRKGEYRYTDEIEKPGELVFCRCYYVWIYNLASLPDDMLTAKGKAVLQEELV